MKYKLIAIFLIFFLIIGSIFLNFYYEKELNYVYHQHLEDSGDESGCLGIDNCSHLPIVIINTRGHEIPFKHESDIGTSTNVSINDNTNINNNIIINNKDYIISDVLVYDNGNEVNSLNSEATKYQARLRYRGRSSLNFDKKGYSLKLVNSNDEKVNKKFLGMPSDSDWVLHGPFIDKTLIRNYMWYNIGQEIMENAPKTRFFELYLDGEYQGLYLAVESVSQSEESRVKMESIRDDSVATSYMIQLDTEVGNEITQLDTFTNYTYLFDYMSKSRFTIKYPDESDLTEEVRKYIYDDFGQFEKMLYSFDYKEYKDYIDVDSFVDYFIINEFTQNYDAGYLSTYIYKDVSGKYKMYMWDFNSASNNYSIDLLSSQKFRFTSNLWYEMLVRDPDFVDAIIKRYKELRKTYLSDEYLNDYIDSTVEYLGPAINRNYEVWGYSFSSEYDNSMTFFHPRDYEESILQLKNSIQQRGEWLDKNIETLRQYCHSSKNKQYNK